MYVTEISNKDVSTLTRVLQLLPGEDPLKHSNRVLAELSLLSSDIKRPNRLSRLVLSSQSSVSPLCKLHKPLNASVVHSLFQLLALEVGIRLNSLISNDNCLTPQQLTRVSSLRQLHTLWLDPVTYERTFLRPSSESRYSYQPDKCEACTLARVGGDLDTLLSLRMALLSRQSRRKVKRYGLSQFLRFVESWLASLSTRLLNIKIADFGQMIFKNEGDGKELKKVRKDIWREKRRRKGQAIMESVQVEGFQTPHQAVNLRRVQNRADEEEDVEEGPSEHDAEISIIDHYAALLSTPHLPSLRLSALSLVSPKAGVSSRALSLLSSSHPSIPSSLYSQPSSLLHRTATDLKDSAEEYTSPRNFWKDLKSKPSPAPILVPKNETKLIWSTRNKPYAYDDDPRPLESEYQSRSAVTRAAASSHPASPGGWTDVSVPRSSYASLVVDPQAPLPHALQVRQRERLAAQDALTGKSSSTARSQSKHLAIAREARVPFPLIGRYDVGTEEEEGPVQDRLGRIGWFHGHRDASDEHLDVSSSSETGSGRRPLSCSRRTSQMSRVSGSSGTVATTWSRIYGAGKEGGF